MGKVVRREGKRGEKRVLTSEGHIEPSKGYVNVPKGVGKFNFGKKETGPYLSNALGSDLAQ